MMQKHKVVKLVVLFFMACFSSACVCPPVTKIKVRDSKGLPMKNVPLKVTLGEGLRWANSYYCRDTFTDKPWVTPEGKTADFVTDKNGMAFFKYTFLETQPSSMELVLGGKVITNREIEIESSRALPAGTTVILSVPNP